MSIDIKHGAFVSRFFSDGSGELMAVFSFTSDAEEWAAAKVAESRSNGPLVVTSSYDGRSTMFGLAKDGDT